MDTVEVCSLTGRLFHIVGPDTAKSRQPIVVLVCGMMSVPLSAYHSCHLPTTDETEIAATRKTAKYTVCLLHYCSLSFALLQLKHGSIK